MGTLGFDPPHHVFLGHISVTCPSASVTALLVFLGSHSSSTCLEDVWGTVQLPGKGVALQLVLHKGQWSLKASPPA